MKMYVYVCTSTSCGKTEMVTYAPSATKKCECGCTMKRTNA